MSDSAARRRALLALLPRVFSAQPEQGALAGVLAAMAAALAELDRGLARTQRDHWLKLASGAAIGSSQTGNRATDNEVRSALDRLGQLLAIDRLDGEETDAYRRRLSTTARVVTRALNTPRALLELAIATLGAEPCALRKRQGNTAIAYGVPPGTIEHCPACLAKERATECPNLAARVLEAWLTDNPAHAQTLTVRPHLLPGAYFTVANPSLDEDVPQLRLCAVEHATHYPCLHNRATGEIILYAGTLQPGEVLSVWPEVDLDESRRYEGREGNHVHPWRHQYPSGRALVISADGEEQRVVSADIYYLTGARLAADNADPQDLGLARFASREASEGPRFADLLRHGSIFEKATFGDDDDALLEPTTGRFGSSEQRVRTPRIRPGADEWTYGVYTRREVAAMAGEMAGPLVDHAPEEPGNAPVELVLSWWARRPASFCLTIPANAWVKEAEARGAARMLARWIRELRPAGIAATIDFPEPTMKESAAVGERARLHTRQHWRETLSMNDARLAVTTQVGQREDHSLGDGIVTWRGVFDNTRIDASRFD